MTDLPEIFRRLPLAHRALHDVAKGRPENSRAAILAAIDAGYGIELDLQMSADGRAMVFHDYELSRLTGQSGPVGGRSAAELERIALTGCDEGIATFSEVLELVAGRAPLLVELKDQDGAMGAAVGRLEEAVATDLQGYPGRVALMSFNPHSVLKLAQFVPDVPRGLTTCSFTNEDWPLVPAATRDRLREIPDYDTVGASFISHEAEDLARARVTQLKARGVAILCWTVRSPEAEAEARKWADNITFEGYLAELPS